MSVFAQYVPYQLATGELGRPPGRNRRRRHRRHRPVRARRRRLHRAPPGARAPGRRGPDRADRRPHLPGRVPARPDVGPSLLAPHARYQASTCAGRPLIRAGASLPSTAGTRPWPYWRTASSESGRPDRYFRRTACSAVSKGTEIAWTRMDIRRIPPFDVQTAPARRAQARARTGESNRRRNHGSPSAAVASRAVDVEPGRSATLTITVRNNGTVVDRYTFEALGDAAPWVTFRPESLSLFPEASGTVEHRPGAAAPADRARRSHTAGCASGLLRGPPGQRGGGSHRQRGVPSATSPSSWCRGWPEVASWPAPSWRWTTGRTAATGPSCRAPTRR